MATYGDLIELLCLAESKCDEHNDIELSELLVTLFKERYPSVYIGRPRRFLDTVRRIAAPTRPSIIGNSKLDGDCLCTYMKKIWKPKIRNPAPKDTDEAPFPSQLTEVGLDEEILEASLALQGDWHVKDIPTVGFYRCLHKFLMNWLTSRSLSKTAIGKFYMAIDHNLKQKSSRPDNIYRFVEKIILSNEPDCSRMNYGIGYQQIHHLRMELKEHDHLIKNLESKLTVTDTELEMLKMKLDATEQELVQAKRAAENASHKVACLERMNKVAVASKSKVIEHYEKLCQDHMYYEDELLEQFSHFSEHAKILEPYMPETVAESSAVDHNQIVFHTSENGKQFTPAIRAPELIKFMVSSEHGDLNPVTLVGKSIEHKFKLDDGEHEWFRGFVIAYDEKSSLHEVAYEGEKEHCHFNLLEDMSAGDLRIV